MEKQEQERQGWRKLIRKVQDRHREEMKSLQEAVGVQNIYLAALNPNKLNALVAICAQHTAAGHKGIVFANHLVVAKIVCECLGEGWVVLSGGVAHGVEEKPRSPEANSDIVERFNAGKLHGMVCTTVGESSMDVHYERFCFVCVMDRRMHERQNMCPHGGGAGSFAISKHIRHLIQRNQR